MPAHRHDKSENVLNENKGNIKFLSQRFGFQDLFLTILESFERLH